MDLVLSTSDNILFQYNNKYYEVNNSYIKVFSEDKNYLYTLSCINTYHFYHDGIIYLIQRTNECDRLLKFSCEDEKFDEIYLNIRCRKIFLYCNFFIFMHKGNNYQVRDFDLNIIEESNYPNIYGIFYETYFQDEKLIISKDRNLVIIDLSHIFTPSK